MISDLECHKLDTPTQVFFYEQDFYVLSNFSAFRLRWMGLDFDTSEAAGLWPCAMTYCGSQQTVHVGGGIYIPIWERPTPVTTEGGGE